MRSRVLNCWFGWGKEWYLPKCQLALWTACGAELCGLEDRQQKARLSLQRVCLRAGVCVCVHASEELGGEGAEGSKATDVFAHNAWIRPCCCKQDVWGTKHRFWKMFTPLSNPLPGAPWHLAFLLLPFSHFHSILCAWRSVCGGTGSGSGYLRHWGGSKLSPLLPVAAFKKLHLLFEYSGDYFACLPITKGESISFVWQTGPKGARSQRKQNISAEAFSGFASKETRIIIFLKIKMSTNYFLADQLIS